ncbi:MAG: chemotaxis protein CheD [Bacteroidota bacterium]
MSTPNQHFLYPAALFASNQYYVVSTILGSCVAVCFYDTRLRIGGINHYMLPFWNGQGLASPKYGNIAIHKLLEKMQSLGSNKKDLRAKVFGGANIFESNLEQFRIGERNIIIANETLTELQIPVVSQSTGGNLGRKIMFDNSTGEVRQKIIEKVTLQCMNIT